MNKKILFLVLSLGLNFNLVLSNENDDNSFSSRITNWFWPIGFENEREDSEPSQDNSSSNSSNNQDEAVSENSNTNNLRRLDPVSEYFGRAYLIGELYIAYQGATTEDILLEFLYQNTDGFTGRQIKEMFDIADNIADKQERLNRGRRKVLNEDCIKTAFFICKPEVALNKDNYKFLLKTLLGSSSISDIDLENTAYIIDGFSAKEIKELFDIYRLYNGSITSEELYVSVYKHIGKNTSIAFLKAKKDILNYYAKKYNIRNIHPRLEKVILNKQNLSLKDIQSFINRAFIEATSQGRNNILDQDLIKAVYGEKTIENKKDIKSLIKSGFSNFKMNFKFCDLTCLKKVRGLNIKNIEQIVKSSILIAQKYNSETIELNYFVVAFYRIFTDALPDLIDRVRILNYYIKKENKIEHAQEQIIESLAKKMADLNEEQILGIINDAKDRSFKNKLYLSNILKTYQEDYAGSNEQKLDPYLRYLLLNVNSI